jgi:2-keto-4-pentenoate hydratase/2-oxohepta-3-ene-1,7-dioic acid hydratase in catechol pathway
VVFAKYASSVIGPGEPIQLPQFSAEVDYEAELGVAIGRRARNVSVAEALEYVFGYLNLNDVSARDLQFAEGGQWTIAKSLDTFTPMGPHLVSSDEVADPQRLHITCTVSGEVLQDSTTEQMVFGVAELVSFLSRGMTLEPGDVIATPRITFARWFRPTGPGGSPRRPDGA